MKFIAIICVFYMYKDISTKVMEIANYANVTLETCGLNALSTKPTQNKCFKWHQTIREMKETLASIENGRYAKLGEFPYTVLIMFWNVWTGEQRTGMSCTGAIVNSYWIITAAHCGNNETAEVRVYVGLTDYPPDMSAAPYISAAKVHRHQFYTANSMLFDIALIKLTQQIPIDRSKANGVCLPSKRFSMFHTNQTVFSGWGFVSDNQTNTKRLKMTHIELNDVRHYAIGQPYIEILGRVKYGQPCIGDSGGPLVQYVNGRAVLIGIQMGTAPIRPATQPCGPFTNTTYFSAIPYYLDFIIRTIREN